MHSFKGLEEHDVKDIYLTHGEALGIARNVVQMATAGWKSHRHLVGVKVASACIIALGPC